MRSACCSIAWFPGIVPVGFLLAEVRPPTLVSYIIYSSSVALRGIVILLNLTQLCKHGWVASGNRTIKAILRPK
jgi:hypothetical protein